MKTNLNRLRVFITCSEEPVAINGFLKKLIDRKREQIVGLGFVQQNRPASAVLQQKSNRKKFADGATGQRRGKSILSPSRLLRFDSLINVLKIVLIFGLWETVVQGGRICCFRIHKRLSRFVPWLKSPSIVAFAQSRDIPVIFSSNVNDPRFIASIRDLRPDLIINQAPGILRRDFLTIPTIGVLNRHNAVLPRNRGRLSPFWTIFHGDPTGGVSIHFVTEALDAGSIVVQRRIDLTPRESARSLAWKCYQLAPDAMVEAIDKIESGAYETIPNLDSDATYNGNPTLAQAIQYRLLRINRIAKHLWQSPVTKRPISESC